MKRKVQKALAISGIAIAIGASGLTLPASANNGSSRQFRSKHERIVRTKKIERFEKTAVTRRVIPGVIETTGDNTLTMKSGDKTYTVNIDSSTRLLNKKWTTVDFSAIKTGDKIRVLGTISDTTISAKTVRDITLQ